MTIYLRGEVNPKMANKLFDAYKTDEKLEVYFDSIGGELSIANAMIDFINRRYHNIELICSGQLMSAALIIALSIKCKKSLLHPTTGLAHLYRLRAEITSAGEPSEYDKKWLKSFMPDKSTTNKHLSLYRKSGFTEEELKAIRNSEDVYLSYKRLKEIFDVITPKYNN